MGATDPSTWLLNNQAIWGSGTAMSSKSPPYDTNCTVTPLIGGFAAMTAICSSLETVITEASGKTAGQCGHVYIAGWRLDALRDLSSTNGWGTSSWKGYTTANIDQTAIGLFFRLLDAGVKLRILVWYPNSIEENSFLQHCKEHYYLYSAIQQKSSDIAKNGGPSGLGIVALDTRTGSDFGTHHQKMIVIRGAAATQVAYCGGVDLAFTRRDAPAAMSATSSQTAAFLGGDWQSGEGMPPLGAWPLQSGPAYPSVAQGAIPNGTVSTDLPDGNGAPNVYGSKNQIWHDQHLMLQGPIVQTLEQQFCERWIDPVPAGNILVYPGGFHNMSEGRNCVFVSDASAASGAAMAPLDTPQSASSSGSSIVQMWRTIPVRNRGSSPSLFTTGEFSNLSGIANACTQASELIWIFDQYFWSLPLARLLNRLLLDTANNPGLCVIIILPPYPDDHAGVECYYRFSAILELVRAATPSLYQRLRIYNLWSTSLPQGIYCHAKVQTYDGSLLVCGSCNLNQRSLLCDTELACAVLDSAVVHDHQLNLWTLLFPNADPIESQLGHTLDLSASGSGQEFFSKFMTAASTSGSFLFEDEYYYSIYTGSFNYTGDFTNYQPSSTWTNTISPNGYQGRPVPMRTCPKKIIEPSSLKHHFPSDQNLSGHPLALDVISGMLTTDATANPVVYRTQ
jgi:phosphatidylserine/phosphatidylglycerophosphate/cardiolipin synthase-like enzyme